MGYLWKFSYGLLLSAVWFRGFPSAESSPTEAAAAVSLQNQHSQQAREGGGPHTTSAMFANKYQ